MEFMSRVLCSFTPTLLHSILTTNLYSDIKPDDSPVKGTKRGKGKKEKKRSALDPAEKRKPKLDELKVLKCLSTYCTADNRSRSNCCEGNNVVCTWRDIIGRSLTWKGANL